MMILIYFPNQTEISYSMDLEVNLTILCSSEWQLCIVI